jgi:hypothetical protein
LTRTVGVNRYQPATSVCSFVRKFLKESSPSYIVNGFGKHPSRQSFDVEVLDCNCAKVLDQPKRKFVLKVTTLILDFGVDFLEQYHRLAATITPLLTTGNLSLSTPKFWFRLFVESGVRHRLPIRLRGKASQSHIQTDFSIQGWKSGCLILNGEAGVPLSTLAFNCDGLNIAQQGSVEFDLDITHSLDSKYFSVEPHPIPVGGESNTVKSTAGLKSGVSWFFSSLDSAKERLESLVHPAKHILGTGVVCQKAVFGCPNFPKLVGLVVIINRLLASLIRIPALLQSRIVEAASFSKLTIQGNFLEACRE